MNIPLHSSLHLKPYQIANLIGLRDRIHLDMAYGRWGDRTDLSPEAEQMFGLIDEYLDAIADIITSIQDTTPMIDIDED